MRSMYALLASCCIPGVSAVPLEDQSRSLVERSNLSGVEGYSIANITSASITNNFSEDGSQWMLQAYVNTGGSCNTDVPPDYTTSWDQDQTCTDFGFESGDNVKAVAAFLPAAWELTLSSTTCENGGDNIYGVVSSQIEARSGDWVCYNVNKTGAAPFLSFSVTKLSAV